jgi:hypothetical protein
VYRRPNAVKWGAYDVVYGADAERSNHTPPNSGVYEVYVSRRRPDPVDAERPDTASLIGDREDASGHSWRVSSHAPKPPRPKACRPLASSSGHRECEPAVDAFCLRRRCTEEAEEVDVMGVTGAIIEGGDDTRSSTSPSSTAPK